jgi:hypothetical protein
MTAQLSKFESPAVVGRGLVFDQQHLRPGLQLAGHSEKLVNL